MSWIVKKLKRKNPSHILLKINCVISLKKRAQTIPFILVFPSLARAGGFPFSWPHRRPRRACRCGRASKGGRASGERAGWVHYSIIVGSTMCFFTLWKNNQQCDQTLRFSAKPADFEDLLRILKPQLRNPQICGFSKF